MRTLLAALLFSVLPVPLSAQPPAREQPEALKPLDWMVGSWEGTSWIEFAPGQRRTNNSPETVQSKVGGAVLLFEGFHKGKTRGQDGKEVEVTTHDSLSMLLYDEKDKRYRFVAYTARQGYGDFEAKLIDGGWRWETASSAGKLRFTIAHTDKDEWFESGEISEDGKSWRKFFEMTLHRVKSRSPNSVR
jgi:hypothetical protein